ncbi:MAG: spondin domain-containing protein [Caldilineaceae bacterium]|nr:spondin domain-containing protein [Caldilineaceae bacterium]
MQQRKTLSVILTAALMLSTAIVFGPAGTAWASEVPTFESSHGGDEEKSMEDAVTFLVRIENISGDSALATPFAPGVWVLHSDAGPLFTTGEADRGYGLEALAEDGDPSQLAAALSDMELHAGVFNTPAGSDAPGVLLPGGAYEFEVKATPHTPYLSFATMLVQSNDLFVAPDEMGIALFDMDGMAMDMMMHDVTADLLLWDAGTEANEEPGTGPNQAPRQSGANTGPADGMATVHVVDDDFTYPEVTALLKVTIDVVMMADDDKMMGEKDEMMSDKDDMMAGDAKMDSIALMEDGPTPYTVVSGDTLGSISKRAYGASKYWSVICSANSLENCNLIHVGDELMLPTHAEAMSMMDDKMMMAEKDGMMGEKDEMMADKDDMESDKDEMMADKDDMESDKDEMMADKDDMMADDAMMGSIELMDDGPTPYTVVSGDTLGSISKRAYGASKYWSVICSANSLEDCNRISVGDELMLPTHDEAMSMMDDKMMMAEKEGMMGEKDEMMADKDDMESDKDEMMADKDDMESDKDGMMAEKDDMMADDAMMESIELMDDGPTLYTVKSGDTLGSIAERAYGDSSYWPAICVNNSEVTEDCNLIHIGDELMLPTKADAELFMEEANAMGPDDAMEEKSDE